MTNEGMADGKMEWKDIDNFITKTRLSQFKECRSVPTQFTFYKSILIFLGIPRDCTDDLPSCVNTLMYINLEEDLKNRNRYERMNDHEESMQMGADDNKDEEEENSQGRNCISSFRWNLLLEVDPTMLVDSTGIPNYSKEEELLRERKRLSSHGITSYEFHQDSGRLLFASGNALYWLDVKNIAEGKSKHAVPSPVSTTLSGTRMDAKICHRNPDLISFIYHGDIYVANVHTGQELRLTFVRTLWCDDCVSAGIPSFVTQEEFDRFTGYWWEPKSSENIEDTKDVEVHKILYEMVDESKVGKQHIVSTVSENNTQVETYRYPKAGSQNAKSALRLVQFSFLKSKQEILDGSIFEHDSKVDLKELIPWAEYLVRCEWMSDGKSIWVQLLSRRQNRLALLRIPLTAFKTISSTENSQCNSAFKISIILEELSDTWINLSDIIYFLPSSNTTTTKLIWSSERLGHRHLYLVTVANEAPFSGSYGNDCNSLQGNGNNLHICDVLSNAELTEGSWAVSPNKIWVDEKRQLIFFVGRKDTPLEEHLYVVSYRFGSEVKRLTQRGFYHISQVDESCRWVVTVASSVSHPCQVQVSKISSFQGNHVISNPERNLNVQLNSLGWLETPRELKFDISPEFFSYRNKKGHTVYGLILKRKNLDLNTKHPTVLIVYGGPGEQIVTNSQKALRRTGLHSLTSLGYVIVMIDTMGSFSRGVAFEAVLKDKMGTVEIEEQVEGLEFAAQNFPFIDLNRVAVHGWSYGGYLSLMGLAQRPDIFKVAIAGAPVVSWELYDTGYTERYMGLPQNNPEGYKRGSVLSYVRQFPKESNRLLIVHGLIDENVHFSHTNLLISSLVQEGKPYQLQIFPNERHGIRHSSSALHFETMLLLFLQNNL
ncbi:dipeptidyl peptidase 9-like [Rhopilema esculentum]|uniref:dipeptidyl peptidase 9-like n=1 Tax=Rhopilema esculentum TaxID=499914 RepID=UPI0031D586F3